VSRTGPSCSVPTLHSSSSGTHRRTDPCSSTLSEFRARVHAPLASDLARLPTCENTPEMTPRPFDFSASLPCSLVADRDRRTTEKVRFPASPLALFAVQEGPCWPSSAAKIGAFRQPIVALDQGRATLDPLCCPPIVGEEAQFPCATPSAGINPLQAPLMRCSSCGSENREGRKFCAGCGAVLTLTCAACGANNQPGERFCGDCGKPLGAAAKELTHAPTLLSISPRRSSHRGAPLKASASR